LYSPVCVLFCGKTDGTYKGVRGRTPLRFIRICDIAGRETRPLRVFRCIIQSLHGRADPALRLIRIYDIAGRETV